jgi:hypothetical protein
MQIYIPIHTILVGVYCHLLSCSLHYLCCHDAVSVCSLVSIRHMPLCLNVLELWLSYLAGDVPALSDLLKISRPVQDGMNLFCAPDGAGLVGTRHNFDSVWEYRSSVLSRAFPFLSRSACVSSSAVCTKMLACIDHYELIYKRTYHYEHLHLYMNYFVLLRMNIYIYIPLLKNICRYVRVCTNTDEYMQGSVRSIFGT